MVDTGSDKTIINQRFVEKISKLRRLPRLQPDSLEISTANGSRAPINFKIIAPALLKDKRKRNYLFQIPMHVAPDLDMAAILGRDFINAYGVIIDSANCQFDIPHLVFGYVNEDVTVPAFSEIVFSAKITSKMSQSGQLSNLENNEVLVEPFPIQHNYGVKAANTLCVVKRGHVLVRMCNAQPNPVVIPRGSRVATVSAVNSLHKPACKAFSAQGSCGNKSSGCKPRRELMTATRLREVVMADLAKTALSEKEKSDLVNLIIIHRDVFAEHFHQLGRTNLYEHSIKLKDPSQTPIKQRPYHTSLDRRKFINEEINRMLENGIAEVSYSPWSSPVCCIPKKNGKLRLCVDLRRLNSVIEPDVHPLPLIEDLLQEISDMGAKYITTLDLTSGFWQIPLRPEDRPKTAFCTHRGLYSFSVLPFGLSTAPAAMQRLVSGILSGLPPQTAILYIDDLAIGASTFDIMLGKLEGIFKAFREAGMTFNPNKCHWARAEAKYLGFTVSEKGITPDADNVQAIVNFPTPRRVRDVRSFLGSASYYRKSVKDFSKIARPLHKLTVKSARFTWLPVHQEAFDSLKTKLVSAPVLAYAKPELPYCLITDASDESVGYVLNQIQDDREVLIACGGKSLSPSQRNWPVHEREAFAIVAGLKQFDHYLSGAKVVIRTDQHSLKFLFGNKQPTGKIARWRDLISSYNHDIQYIKGCHNPADFLSRRDYSDSPYEDLSEDFRCATFVAKSKVLAKNQSREALWRAHADKIPKLTNTQAEIVKMQQVDTHLGPMVKYLTSGEIPSDGKLARSILLQAGDFMLIDGLLYHLSYPKGKGPRHTRAKIQLAVPDPMVYEILCQLHDSPLAAHPGIYNTILLISERYYWRTLNTDVNNYVRSCHACNQFKDPPSPAKQQLTITEPRALFEMVAVDIVGPFVPSEDNYKYVLTIQDHLTTWLEAVPLKDQTSETIAKALLETWISRYSVPRHILSDQGLNFCSSLIEQLCKLLGVKKVRTTAYHPAGNGSLERAHHTLKSKLKMYINTSQKDWPDHLPAVLFAMRVSPNATRGVSSYHLLFGQEPRFHLESEYQIDPQLPRNVADRMKYLAESVYQMRLQVSENIQQSKLDRKVRYDARARSVSYKVGDLVWLHKPTLGKGVRKLKSHWCGPFKILRMYSDIHADLAWATSNKPLLKRVHTDRLKLTVSRYLRPPSTTWAKCKEADEILTEDLLDSDASEPRPRGKIRSPTRTSSRVASTDHSTNSAPGDSDSEVENPLLTGLFLGGGSNEAIPSVSTQPAPTPDVISAPHTLQPVDDPPSTNDQAQLDKESTPPPLETLPDAAINPPEAGSTESGNETHVAGPLSKIGESIEAAKPPPAPPDPLTPAAETSGASEPLAGPQTIAEKYDFDDQGEDETVNKWFKRNCLDKGLDPKQVRKEAKSQYLQVQQGTRRSTRKRVPTVKPFTITFAVKQAIKKSVHRALHNIIKESRESYLH